ncbi:MAG: N-acetyltransferase family protein [Chloroflexota bacterium]
MTAINIRDMQPTHWEAVAAIYGEGIATRQATFETTVPNWDDWDNGHLSTSRLVAVDADGETIMGWAALSPVSGRCVYAGVAEVSVYVAAAARGRGVGKTLLKALVNTSEAEGIWTLQAGIFPENAASRALHTACGFREIGYRERIGQLDGVWRDTVLMERRSTVVGAPGAVE